MQTIPLELIGQMNAPDLELDSVTLGPKGLTIIGNIVLNSVIDKIILQGTVKLLISSRDSSPISVERQQGSEWQLLTSLPELAEIYLISCEEYQDRVWLEGRDSERNRVRIVVPHAEIAYE